jgi:hypothetical protein
MVKRFPHRRSSTQKGYQLVKKEKKEKISALKDAETMKLKKEDSTTKGRFDLLVSQGCHCTHAQLCYVR